MRKTTLLICTLLCLFLFIKPSQAQIFIEDFDGSNITATTTIGQTCGVGDNDDYFGITDLTTATSVTYIGGVGNFLGAQDTDGGDCNLPIGDIVNASIIGIDITGQAGLVVCFNVAEDTASDGKEDWDANSSVVISASIDGGASSDLFTIQATGDTNTSPGFDCDGDGLADGSPITDIFTTYCIPIASVGTSLDINIAINNLEAGDEDIAIDNIAVYSDETTAPPAATSGCAVMAVCAITNVSISSDGVCNGNDVNYTVCADISGGSGDYNLTDVDNGNSVIASLTGQPDGNVCFDVVVAGPTAASSINVNIVDAMEPICLSEAVSVTILECPIITCDAKIIKFPANGN